jgi:hypothetical protein
VIMAAAYAVGSRTVARRPGYAVAHRPGYVVVTM